MDDSAGLLLSRCRRTCTAPWGHPWHRTGGRRSSAWARFRTRSRPSIRRSVHRHGRVATGGTEGNRAGLADRHPVIVDELQEGGPLAGDLAVEGDQRTAARRVVEHGRIAGVAGLFTRELVLRATGEVHVGRDAGRDGRIEILVLLEAGRKLMRPVGELADHQRSFERVGDLHRAELLRAVEEEDRAVRGPQGRRGHGERGLQRHSFPKGRRGEGSTSVVESFARLIDRP